MSFKGNNKMTSTTELVGERIRYKLGSQDDTNVIDYNFTDRVYYGKIDSNYNSIYPREQVLKGIGKSSQVFNAPMVMNFVADAFEAFTRKIEQAKFMGKVDDNSYLFDIKVHKAYENPQQIYISFVNEYINEFNKAVDNTKILKYEDWMSEFLIWHSNNGSNFPITFSGFQKSKRSNIFTSGLAISLSDKSIGDDSQKEIFLNDKQHGFYLNAAKQYGFNVHQNAPWILIADLNSPALSLYLKNIMNRKRITIIDTIWSILKTSNVYCDIINNN